MGSIPGASAWRRARVTISQRVCELLIHISLIFLMLLLEKNCDQIRSQFCTCHNSWAVMACAKLWHDLIIVIIIKEKRFFRTSQFWAHITLCEISSWGHRINDFSHKIQIYWKFCFAITPILIMLWSDKILQQTQQLCCYAMCKTL